MRIRETLTPLILAGLLAALPAAAIAQSTLPGTSPSAQPETPTTMKPGKLPDGVKAPSGGNTTIERAPSTKAPVDAANSPASKAKLVGLPVYTSDGQRIGRVSAVEMGTDGEVKEIHAKVGGFFGFGATLVRIETDKFQKAGKRVQLSLSSKQTGQLPKVKKPTNS